MIGRLRLFKDWTVYAKDLDDAYAKGYFSGSMSRYELMDRITKANEDARWFSSETHKGLWISDRFICGIGHQMVIPRFTIVRKDPSQIKHLNYATEHGDFLYRKEINLDQQDGKIIARGWPVIFNRIKKAGYEVDDTDLPY